VRAYQWKPESEVRPAFITGRFDFLAVTASQDENAAIVGALMVCVLIAILCS